ncbi:MAG TPA: ATP-binding protein, partial [Acetobacteraceae bacterium]|nr:ATP-binding protein [Acetobacteraceae bacterium]
MPQRNAAAEIVRVVLDRSPMLVVTGPPRIGKTTVLRQATDQLRVLGERITTIELPSSDRAQLREVAAQALGRDTVPLAQPALDLLIDKVATSQEGLGPHILVVDDVHRIALDAFQFLRGLASRTGTEPAWQVVLSGRPEFRDRIQLGNLSETGAGLPVLRSLEPLTETEARALIARRLVDSDRAPQPRVTSGALLLLLEAGEGIPGRLIALLDAACAHAAARGQAIITRDIIAGAAGVARPAIPSPRPERPEPRLGDRWLAKSLGGVSAVLALVVGVVVWQLVAPLEGAETQA